MAVLESSFRVPGCRVFQAVAGSGRCQVGVCCLVTPNGLAAFAYGGELVHVGGLAFSGEELGEGSFTFVRPTHKDHILAETVAQVLSHGTGQAVFATAGFHVDDITTDEIALVLENGKCAAESVLLQIQEHEE